jgi:2-desacetyl-2-hydroxyethyl bacteriochlorophyllide A dehydrogenase
MIAKRVVFPEANRVALVEEPLPEPQTGEVQLRTIVSLISTGTELTLLSGDHAPGSFWSSYGCFPVRPGFGQVAEVVAVGPGVDSLQAGDRVLASGGHRSASVARAEKLRRLPPEVFPEEAVFHTIANGVINALRVGEVALGDAVVIVGLGLLGQCAVRLARAAGARPIIGVDLSSERRDLAGLGGATAALAPQSGRVREMVEELTGGRLGDVVLEMTGDPGAIPLAVSLARARGRYVQVGCPRGKTELDFNDAVLIPGLRIVGATFARQPSQDDRNSAWSSRRGTDVFLALVEEGSLDLQSLITQRFAWRDAADAYRALRENPGKSLGVIIDWAD